MLLIHFLLVTACVSSRIYHDSNIDDEKENFHDMLRELYNKEQLQEYNRRNDVVVDYNTRKNKIESSIHTKDKHKHKHTHKHKHKREHKHKHKHKHKHRYTIQMPGVAPKKMDTYLCQGLQLPVEESYIVKYEPAAKMQIAHHMLLFGCEVPFKEEGYWDCREMQPVCGSGRQSIMYAWAKNAPSLEMPENVGFHVGGDTGYNYLVLQVHYLHVDMLKDGKTDSSGVSFWLDREKKRYLAGIYLLADGYAPIPPHRPKAYIDMGCYYTEGPKFIAFRYRVHAHKLGVVITGYRVRDNKWQLIGRGDPQRPQAFYEVLDRSSVEVGDSEAFSKQFNGIEVKPGDTLMGRCTYNSTSRDTVTRIGATHHDEMCNFYIMYFYDSEDGDDEATSCLYPEKKFYESYPVSSDVPLAEMERRYHENHTEMPVLV